MRSAYAATLCSSGHPTESNHHNQLTDTSPKASRLETEMPASFPDLLDLDTPPMRFKLAGPRTTFDTRTVYSDLDVLEDEFYRSKYNRCSDILGHEWYRAVSEPEDFPTYPWKDKASSDFQRANYKRFTSVPPRRAFRKYASDSKRLPSVPHRHPDVATPADVPVGYGHARKEDDVMMQDIESILKDNQADFRMLGIV